MAALVYTPLVRGHAIELSGSRLWRNKLLPVGQVDYKGRKLQFTRPYLQDLASAFTAKAYDQVPFQLCRGRQFPYQRRGAVRRQVVDADVDENGLWITVRPTERGQKILEENPLVGVSASMPRPRIPGLGGWQMRQRVLPDVQQLSLRAGSTANPRSWAYSANARFSRGSVGCARSTIGAM